MFTAKLSNKISNLYGAEIGRRAFVLANGPSVALNDLSKLKGELVIGMNASTILEKKFGFRQDYYVCSDERFLNHQEKRRWATGELNKNTKRIFRSELRRSDDPSFEDRTWYVPAISRDGFSERLEVGFFYGCTTTMLAIQLAYHLGVKDVYLMGVDLKYPDDSPRFYRETEAQLDDANTSVQIFNIKKAEHFFVKNGGRILNCSKNSLLRPYLGWENFDDVFGFK